MMAVALNTVIVDGQEYKPGDVIPDFKSIKCVDTREPRKYQGLSADVSVLNDVIAKYASGGASCFMSDTGEYYEYDRKEKTWKLITNIIERGFGSEKAYGALKHMLKNVSVSDEKIQSAVTDYLTVNPVLPGATTEQAQQIEQNKTDVASLKEETGSLKEDLDELRESGTKQLFNYRDANIVDIAPSSSGNVSIAGIGKAVVIPINTNNEQLLYIFSNRVCSKFIVGAFTEYPKLGDSPVYNNGGNNIDNIYVNVNPSIKYLLLYCWNKNNDTDTTIEDVIKGLMVQYGGDFTGYESYYRVKGIEEIKEIANNANNKAENAIDYSKKLFPVVATRQLFDKYNANVINAYINTTVMAIGTLFRTVVIPVTVTNETRMTVHRSIITSRFSVAVADTVDVENGTTVRNLVMKNNTQEENITVNVDSNVKAICVFFYHRNYDSDISIDDFLDGLMVQFGAEYTGYEIYGSVPHITSDYIADKAIKKVHLSDELLMSIESVLDNKKMNCLGDSFTDDGISYEFVLKNRVPSLTTVHVAKGGSAICKDIMFSTLHAPSFINRIDGTAPDYDIDATGETKFNGLSTDADITVIMGGINDCSLLGNGEITMGDINSEHTVDTFYGGMQLLLDRIIQMISNQFILGVIPPTFTPSAPYTTYIDQVQNAEREIYKKYHIPFVDLAWDCFAMSDNPTIMALYRKSVTGTTNYHPNADGHKKICDLIQGKLESMIIN